MTEDNQRTREEIEEALNSLQDAFYPRKVREVDGICSQCKSTTTHTTACDVGRSYLFQGWEAHVKRTRAPEARCQQPNCTSPATARIRLNTWGVLGEYDVCEPHSRFSDGTSRDLTLCDCL
jgi:hypothetical protein